MTGSESKPVDAQELTLTQTNDERGHLRRWIGLDSDGSLTISGHDIGRGVDDVWGMSEYEFTRTVAPAAVTVLRTTAGLGDGPLLAAIRDRFGTTRVLEEYLEDHDIPSEFFSRVGD